jgi:preprotein translocase subunit SecE
MKLKALQRIPSFIVRYLREVKSEMKKVTWPSRQETLHYTLIVIGISVVMALFLGGMDYLFNLAIKQLI